MEELLVYALLMAAGLLPWEDYQSRLHALFLEYPADELLMELECETTAEETRACLQRYFDYGCSVFDRTAFGTCLMDKLDGLYETCGDIGAFSTNMYCLWTNLPEVLRFEQPFWSLSYADDCLSYGDEGQTRALYEETFQFYREKER